MTMTKAAWAKTPRDYKAVIDGQRFVLRLNAQTGGTELIPVTLEG